MKNEAPGWFGPVSVLIVVMGTAVCSHFLDPIVRGVFPNWSPLAVTVFSSALVAFAFCLPIYLLARWRHWTK